MIIKMSKKTVFNDNWLTDSEFKEWLKKDSNNLNKAKCVICGGSSFSLGNMGKQALKSHAKGKKHCEKVSLMTKVNSDQTMMSKFVKTDTSNKEQTAQPLDVPPPSPVEQEAGPSSKHKSVDQWLTKEDTLKAEVLWAMKTLTSKYSSNSCVGINDLFSTMFPDSEIAKQFQCSKTKCSYLISYGLAPYYHEQLMQQLTVPDTKFVISFDESLNKPLQLEQMDILVRLWDCNVNRVLTRYFTSQFLGHTRASDLVCNFKTGIGSLRYSNLLQISMDGPATNWKFFDEILKDRELEDPSMPNLLNLGSCGLHVVHGSLKNGTSASGWSIDSLLRSPWYVFEDSPARREDYESVSECQLYPLRFCSTRWLEDIPVAERAIEIWPGIVKYVKKVSSGPKSKVPSVSSFQKLIAHVQDPLTIAKLHFFINVAEVLQSFLKKFQSDNPLLPFLAEELYSLLKVLLQCFIQPEVLKQANSKTKLAAIDVMAKENVVHPKRVDLGFATAQHIKKAEKDKLASELQILTFQKECILFLQKLCSKLMERCPLLYPCVRYLVSLNPNEMGKKPESAKQMFKKLLHYLMDHKLLTARTCDSVMLQYSKWLSNIQEETKDEYESFSMEGSTGIDALFYRDIGSKAEFGDLFGVVKNMLILSHGQSSIERGFSDNKELLKGNMSEDTLITYRRAYDGIKSENRPIHECVSKPLLESCRHAYRRYKAHAQEKKKDEEKEQKEKQKELTRNQLNDARKRTVTLKKLADKLVAEADDLAKQAESKNNLELLVKSNALREKSHGKRKELDEEMKNVEHLEKKLKH